MDDATVIATHELHCKFGSRAALRGLSLNVKAGVVHALVGANGAGKSTLLRILLGFVRPDAGHASVLGHACENLPAALRARIAYVNEDHPLPSTMRVGELVAVHRRRHLAHWREGVLENVVTRFSLPSGQRVDSLSRGERAGLCLALALAQGPTLLLLDEPTLGLDVVARRTFIELLLQVALDSDCTVVYASHHMEEVERLAEQLIVLRNGRVFMQDAPDEIAARVTCWQAEFPFGSPAQWPNLAGQLGCNERGPLREWVLLDADPVVVRSTLHALGAARISHGAVGLERAIGALLEHRDA